MEVTPMPGLFLAYVGPATPKSIKADVASVDHMAATKLGRGHEM
jgi:hypothetical protein